MKKQTAVEWLVEQMINQLDIRIENITTGIELFEQAKAMEREQIKQSYIAGFNYRDTFNWECDAPWDTIADLKHNEQEFDKYYNETYKGGEQ